MVTYYVLDGYNILHRWGKTSHLLSEDLSQARDILIDSTANYLGYIKNQGVVVFDGQDDDLYDEVSQSDNLEIIFSKKGETADSYIEKRVKSLKATGEVYVVTDDGALQKMILTYDCYRLTVREFLEKIESVSKDVEKAEYKAMHRNTLDERVPEEVRQKLEKMRRKKD